MAYESYRDLRVWQKLMDLVVAIYQLTGHFPTEEKFGLTSHMRRAAVSIPSNIAEGHGRSSRKEFAKFLWIANGSRTELDTQLIIAGRLSLVSSEELANMQETLFDISRMLAGLRNSLRRSSTSQRLNE